MLVLLTPVALGAQETGAHEAVDTVLAALIPAELRTAALASAPELSVRRAEIAAADARRAAAGFATPAILGIENEEARNGRLDRGNLRLDVTRDFLSGRRRTAERAVADADVRLARVGLAAAERRTLADVARALYGAAGWRAVARRLVAQDSLLSSAEVSVRSRLSVGEARYVDVLRLRTERLRVQSDRAAAETEAAAARIGLAALVGADDDRVEGAITAVDASDRGPTGPSIMTLAGRLPAAPALDLLLALAADVRLADARVSRSAAQRRLLLARQRPAFSASLGVQRLAADDRAPGLGPVMSAGMSLPFTAGRANRTALVAADLETALAIAARGATATTVRAALSAARARYEAARRRAAAFDATLLTAAREERESALAAYRTGDLSLIELLDFERALSRAEIDRTRASLDALAALADLLSGAPSMGPFATLSVTQEAGAARTADDR